MIKYGYEDGRRGTEAKIWLDGKTLKVKVYGSDHVADWWTNLKAWPRKYGFHRGWYNEAYRLYLFIVENFGFGYNQVDIIGHSAGGAIGAILAMYYIDSKVIRSVTTVNSPKFCNRKQLLKIRAFLTSLVHRGDICAYWPFLYAKPKRKYYGDVTWFWKAHNDMPDEWKEF